MITSIGNFLGALPAARELYAEHVDDTPQEQVACYEEEDPFGHQLAGMNDGPTACEEQGLFDRGDSPYQSPETLQPTRGHKLFWTGLTWQCKDCFKQFRSKRQIRDA